MDGHLYDPEGKFLFRGKKLGICALCKEKDWVYDVGALAPSARFCRTCVTKEGSKTLRKDANVALRRAKRAADIFTAELHDMSSRYKAKFGAPIAWDLPQVVRSRKG